MSLGIAGSPPPAKRRGGVRGGGEKDTRRENSPPTPARSLRSVPTHPASPSRMDQSYDWPNPGTPGFGRAGG